MTKKKEEVKKDDFNLDDALSTVNRYLLEGFKQYIESEKVTSQKQFDKLYNDYKEFR